MRERKATLMAEVRFLRRRYRHLSEDQPVMQPPEIKKGKGKSNGGKKGKTSPTKKTSEVETRHVSLPDLNQDSVKAHDDTKTSLERKGEEEEEATEAENNDQEMMRVEESSLCKRTSTNMEMQQQKEMKLSSCRNGKHFT